MSTAAKVVVAAVLATLALVALQLGEQRRVLAQVSVSTVRVHESMDRARSAARRYDASYSALVSALAEKASLSTGEADREPLVTQDTPLSTNSLNVQERPNEVAAPDGSESPVSSVPPEVEGDTGAP